MQIANGSENMGEKNSIAAEAKFYVETGHLELTRFELVVDGKQLSTLDTRQDVRSKQIPRILRIFHEYSRTGHVKLPKKQAPWNKLWGFLRKVYKKEVSKPAWYKAMFRKSYCQMLWTGSFQAAASWGLIPSMNLTP